MTRFLMPLALVAALALGSDLSAHGGTYKGPGDVVPPSGGGATAPTAPTGPAAPTAPATPGAPTPASPSTPTTPNLPSAPSTTTVQTAVTAAAPMGADLSIWEFWWEFNKEPFLNLKAKIQSGGVETDGGGILVGLGGAAPKNNTFKPTPGQIQGSIVPALLNALDTGSNIDLQSSCLISLGKIGGNPQIPTTMQPFLGDQNQEIAETAALSFGILQSEEALPVLLDLLRDTPQGRKYAGKQAGVPLRTRTFAVYGLGLLGNATAKPEIQNKVVETLWDVLSTDQERLKDIRVACVISLGLSKVEDASTVIDNLTGYLQNDDMDFLVRSHCPNAIAKLLRENGAGPDARGEAAEMFIQLLGSRSTQTEIRQSCVQALGMVTMNTDPFAERVTKVLFETAVRGRDQQEKNFTSISLAYIGSNPAQTAGKDSEKIVENITEFLVQQLQKGSSSYRTWAGLSLGVMAFKVSEDGGTPSSVATRAVRASFQKEKNPSRKSCYAISLGLMKNESAKKDIRDAMVSSRNPQFRGYAAVALGLMSAREYKDDITKIVMESRRLPDLLRQASIGLGLMSDREVVGTLLDLMQPSEGTTPSTSVLSAVSTAIGFIGDNSSVAPLVDMMQDPDMRPLARAFSAVALGIVADEEELPWNSKIAENLNYRASVSTLTDNAGGSGILDIL